MSFLYPLYIAGLAALSLPLIFHLIRRSPRGHLRFSSLMFLRASPPRLTRRSRLDHLFLLFLRVLALILLSLAFARPFLRDAAELDAAGGRGRRIALLVDSSASMRRGNLWGQALRRVGGLLEDLTPADRVALYAFDEGVRGLVSFEGESAAHPARRAALVRRQLEGASPTWAATDLGAALVEVADALDVLSDGKESGMGLEIALVTDLQEGSRLEALDAYQWPADVRLAVMRVASPGSTDAGLQILMRLDGSESRTLYRARVTNARDSSRERFSLRWVSGSGAQPKTEPLSVYVPPGESRVVRVPRPSAASAADRLLLSGDDHDFDNSYYVAPFRREEIAVRYIGLDAADDPEGMRFYLERAFSDSARHRVRVVAQRPDEPLAPGEEPPSAPLVVVTAALPEDLQDQLRRYVEGGGTVLCVLKDAIAAPALAVVLEREDLRAAEASTGDYAMLSYVDFAHPLFASFSDPRFSDFTKIHFWKHRHLDIEPGSDARVLARFDDGDPAIVERLQGRGRWVVLTSGWHPEDSQLARSSKFVPLLSEMLDREGDAESKRLSYRVGDRVPLPGDRPVSADLKIRKPDGSAVQPGDDASAFDGADQPGVYTIDFAGSQRQFAVNIAPEESKTASMGVEELERRGVRLGTQSREESRRRQMRESELESGQKLWRWLIAAALLILIAETWLAGRLARPAT